MSKRYDWPGSAQAIQIFQPLEETSIAVSLIKITWTAARSGSSSTVQYVDRRVPGRSVQTNLAPEGGTQISMALHDSPLMPSTGKPGSNDPGRDSQKGPVRTALCFVLSGIRHGAATHRGYCANRALLLTSLLKSIVVHQNDEEQKPPGWKSASVRSDWVFRNPGISSSTTGAIQQRHVDKKDWERQVGRPGKGKRKGRILLCKSQPVVLTGCGGVPSLMTVCLHLLINIICTSRVSSPVSPLVRGPSGLEGWLTSWLGRSLPCSFDR